MNSKVYIVDKHSNPNYGRFSVVRQKGTPLQGIREACEDILCRDCTEKSSGDLKLFKACKQKCFEEKENEIVSCCKAYCPENNLRCLQACETALVYGEGPPPIDRRTKTNPNEGRCNIM